MASENRVDPWGRVFSTPERGFFMGNRDFAPEIKALCGQIIESQKREIAEMEALLDSP